jgi:hypothetical protein
MDLISEIELRNSISTWIFWYKRPMPQHLPFSLVRRCKVGRLRIEIGVSLSLVAGKSKRWRSQATTRCGEYQGASEVLQLQKNFNTILGFLVFSLLSETAMPICFQTHRPMDGAAPVDFLRFCA